MSSKNKLRHEKNIKFRIYIGIIVFLLLLCCGLYIAYEMMCYTLETGKTAVSIYDLPEFCNYLASPLTTVAIDFETIIMCFKYQATARIINAIRNFFIYTGPFDFSSL